MDDLVNALYKIADEIRGSGFYPWLDGDRLLFAPEPTVVDTNTRPSLRLRSNEAIVFRTRRLYRASSKDVEEAAAPDTILILSSPTQKAARVARHHNHITVPNGSYRIIGPGIAIFKDSPIQTAPEHRRVKLQGLTGVMAETLLLERRKVWSVGGLAKASSVSAALAHRLLTRLDAEGLTSSLQGDRRLNNPRALAELWSQEETAPELVAKGYLYGNSTEAVAGKLLEAVAGGALGGVIAANAYQPVLTRVNAPVRLWVPEAFNLDVLQTVRFEPTDAGTNVEIVRAKGSPWRAKMTVYHELQMVSPWRAWMEIANQGGRVQELADELIGKLLSKDKNP